MIFIPNGGLFRVLDNVFRERLTDGKVYLCQILLSDTIILYQRVISYMVGDVLDKAG